MSDRVTRLAARAPRRYRQMYERALRGELAPRAAIKAKCYECVCWQRFDGGEDRIGRCTVTGCPLHAYRPFQNAQEPAQTPEGEGWAVQGRPRASPTDSYPAPPYWRRPSHNGDG